MLTWPAEREVDVAYMVKLMDEQDQSSVRLSDDQ